MPATPARIGFITQEYRIAEATDAFVEAAYGKSARKDDEPLETYFVNLPDAEDIADERRDILSRRQRIMASILGKAESLSYRGALPNARVIDDEREYDRTALVQEISIDYETGEQRIVTGG